MSVEIYDPTKRADGRDVGPEGIGKVIARFDNSLSDKGRPIAAAMRAWLAVSGPRGRAHTRGVYVVEPTAPGRPRVLKVYVDSNAVVSDMRTNTEVFVVKLSHVGLDVDAVEFRLSRKVGMERGQRVADDDDQTFVRDSRETSARPEHSDGWEAEADAMLEGVEDGRLRESLRKAMVGE